MSTELVKRIEFDSNQVALIKKQITPNASDTELQLFLYQAQRTGLDPLTRQIYCIHRGGKMTIQTSIDGFRVIAERSGDYGGQDEPVFTEENGKLICCKITVYRFRGDIRYPAAVGVSYMSEYNAGGPMWTKMPHTMLSKCAEAVALRKAYPQDLSGLYTMEEMDQAEPKTQDADFSNVPDEAERKILVNLVFTSTFSEEDKEKYFKAISTCGDYKSYAKIKDKLEARQVQIDQIANPSQKDINSHLKKSVA